jgi:hypothetical protein
MDSTVKEVEKVEEVELVVPVMGASRGGVGGV